MPICSYLVIPDEGWAGPLVRRLDALPGCEAVQARNRDVLLLVTDTPGLEEEAALRERVEAMDGIRALMLTFGEIDPETPVADPVKVGEREGRELPMAQPDRDGSSGSRNDDARGEGGAP